jgi:glyoxylase-like metal-dependent hydrolase (beta-lactamase superfamily II)
MLNQSWMGGALALLAAMSVPVAAADKTIEAAAQAMGTNTLKSVRYSGEGSTYGFAQAGIPGGPWPRFNAPVYSVAINYDTGEMRQEIVRTQGEHPPSGGAGQPMAGKQTQIDVLNGKMAWSERGTSAIPRPAAAGELSRQLWMTAHGVIKTALSQPARVEGRNILLKIGGHDIKATLNSKNLLERITYLVDNPVLGDMPVEVDYLDYKDFGGIELPTHLIEKQDQFPTLDIVLKDIQPNSAVSFTVPANVAGASPRAPIPESPAVQTEQLADGVFYFNASNYHSMAVEFRDYIVVLEAPIDNARSVAVNQVIHEKIPGKPIKYLVNTHTHFDHSGGLREFVAEGVTIITHENNKPYYDKVWARPRTLNPDVLSKSPKAPIFETMTEKRVITDGARTIELHHIQGNGHHPWLLMVYFPKERILFYGDMYNPPDGDNPRDDARTKEYATNLYQNIQRVGLKVDRLAPVHGHVVPLDNLKVEIGLIPWKKQAGLFGRFDADLAQ